MDSILIAEDNRDDYFILEHALKRAKLNAPRWRVRDGVEAQHYLTGEPPFSDRIHHPLPGLIISDLKMPRVNGLELLRWTRRQPLIKRIPFIILSASGNVKDIDEAYEGFANSYHVKPSRLEDLVVLVQRIRAYWFAASVRPQIPAEFVLNDPEAKG